MDTINGMSIFSWAAKAVTKTWNKVVSTVKCVVQQVIRITASAVKKVVSTFKSAVFKAVTKVINSINLNQCVKKAINDIKPSDEYMWMARASCHESTSDKFFGYHGYGGNEKNYGWYHFTVSRNKHTSGLWAAECDLLS